MKRQTSISHALSLATCSLLGHDALAAGGGTGWQTDSAMLFYAEKDRVSVFEPMMIARKDLGDDEFVSLQLVYDSLSGATPTGAAPASFAQTFTTPSCGSTYTAAANSQPTRRFSDARGSLSLGWDKPLSRMVRTQLNGHISGETDYASLGISGSTLFDFNNKNTTLTLSLGFDGDHVAPASGKPVALTSISSCGGGGGGGDEEGESEGEDNIFQAFSGYKIDKEISSGLIGVTQLLSQQTLVQANYSYTRASGYLTDPYKVVSVVDNTGSPVLHLYESRPDNHTWQSLFAKLAWGFQHDTLQLSYRYFWDDWDIASHTADLAYQFVITDGLYLRPYVRYYQQSAARFYRHSYRQGESIRYVSADQRLGEFTGRTLGIRAAYGLGANNEIYLRLARYRQTGNSHPSDAVGNQSNFDLFPTLSAIYTQLGISYQF